MTREILITFASGASLSAQTLDLSGNEKLIGIMFEAGYNTTALTFEAYDTASTPNEMSVNDLNQSEVNLTIDQSVDGYYPVDPQIFAGISKLKLRRGTQASPYTTGVTNSIIKAIVREY